APAGLSMMPAAPTAPQPTIRLPLPPTARPAGEHAVMPKVAKLIVRRTVPEVLTSATPPGSVAPPVLNCGMETKNVPVFGSHADCSMPPFVIPPMDAGTVMGLMLRTTGGCPFVVV